MAGLLDGIRVLELATTITGPLVAMMLGDLGADVIKVEKPSGGDPFRGFQGGLYSPNFGAYNRNKRSIALDLQSVDGRAALDRLIKRSDILIENFRPGVLERLGYNDQRLQQFNPRLIRCSITGFGKDGPYAQRPCYDSVAQAVGGMASLFLDPANPDPSGPTISDNATGYTACNGILAALFERQRTGRARRVDVNMIDTTIAFMPDPFAYSSQAGYAPNRHTRVRRSQTFAFRCSDDKLICVHLSSPPKFWEGFVTALGAPELKDDPRYKTRPLREERYFEITQIAAAIIAKNPLSYWMARFNDNDVPSAPIHDITAVPDDPQVKHLDPFFTLNHPTEGAIRAIRRPTRFDGSRDDQPNRPPPTLGEHTNEILREIEMEK